MTIKTCKINTKRFKKRTTKKLKKDYKKAQNIYISDKSENY